MTRRRHVLWLGLAGLVLAAVAALAAFVPVGGFEIAAAAPAMKPAEAKTMDLSRYSAERPGRPLSVLFIHHSCGGQLLAPLGASVGQSCIYESHPNGGDLRGMLRSTGYEVHEASYDSAIGQDTDLFDWLPKFRDRMDQVLSTDHQDRRHGDGRRNQIVVFKSCFTESWFVGEGQPPGKAEGPELTLLNAQATLTAVRDVLARHPEVLFVYVTAPPIAPKVPPEPLWKWAARRVTGRPPLSEKLATAGSLARRFNEWVVSPDGWLAGYSQKNLVVFDYYAVLTEGDATGLSRHASGDGTDSHPSSEGNQRAARAFVPFLNRAARRAGLIAPAEVGASPAEEAAAALTATQP